MASSKKDKNITVYTIPESESLPKKDAGDENNFWHVDKEMLRFKLHYFFFHGAFSVCLPYITILAQKRVGISVSALSAILTSQRCIFILVKPSVGYIADYLKKLKAIMSILAVIGIVSYFVLLAVPRIEKGPAKDFVDNSSIHDLLNTSNVYEICEFQQNNSLPSLEVLNLKCQSNENLCFRPVQHLSDIINQCSERKNNISENVNNKMEYTIVLEKSLDSGSNSFFCKVCCRLTEKCQKVTCELVSNCKEKLFYEIKPKSDFQMYQFWLYGLITTVGLACINNLFCLTDTACCDSVQKIGAQFGRQSMWGAIGWGLMCPIGGLLNDYTGDFLASWVLMTIMSFMALVNMTKLKIENPEFSKNLLKDIGTVLSSKEFLAFLICVIMNGVGTAIMWFYLVLFLTDIGGSRFLCGVVKFVQSFIGGIPFMFFSGWVIRKIGHFNVIILSLLAYSIRFFWYSQMHNPWLVLPIEVLHGITEGLFYTNVASYAKLSAKPGTEATTQALLFTAHEGIGVGIGCVVTGLGFDSIGGHRTFLYLSIYAACAMAITIILQLLLRTKKRTINVTSYANK